MSITPCLAFVVYEDVQSESRAVVRVRPVERNRSKYPKDVPLLPEEDVRTLSAPPAIRTHMKVKLEDGEGGEAAWHIATLVFRVDGEDLSAVTRIESGPEPARQTEWGSYYSEEEKRRYYFFPAKFKGREASFEDDFKMEPNPVNTAGALSVTIHCPEPLRVEVLIRCENEEAMLEDLFRIQRQLAISGSSPVSFSERREQNFSVKWADIWNALSEHADELGRVLKGIASAPAVDLRRVQERVPVRKVKRYDARTILECAARGSPRVRTTVSRPHFDIYEHRVVRQYLQSLRQLTEGLKRDEAYEKAQKKRFWSREYELDWDEFVELDESLAAGQRKDPEGFGKALKNAMEKRDVYFKQSQDTETPKPEDILKRLDRLLELPFLRAAAPRGEPLDISNLFQMDPRYSKVYQAMREKQRVFCGITFLGEERYPANLSHVIYEYWCYIQLIVLFYMKYGFSITKIGRKEIDPENGSTELVEAIGRRLRKGKLKDPHVTLYKRIRLDQNGKAVPDEINMEVEILYDQQLCFVDPRSLNRQPDYQLILRVGEGPDKARWKTWHFCMDAKLRDYDTMHTAEADDLFDVAWSKYIEDPRAKGHAVNGSYILHSDSGSRHTAFYGGTRDSIRGKTERFDGPVKDGALRPCMVGSVPLVPHRTLKLNRLVQMIMERFVGGCGDAACEALGYRSKCWLCGCENLAVELDPKKFYQGKPWWYRITCRGCGQQWIQTICNRCEHSLLGKHFVNYLDGTGDYKWTVICPVCGANPTIDAEEEAKL